MRGAARLAASQRRARRRMLLRGRITIAIGLGALVLLLWSALAGVGSDASAEPHALAALPEVGAFEIEEGVEKTPDVDPVAPVLPEPLPPPGATAPEPEAAEPARPAPAKRLRAAPAQVIARIPVPLPSHGAAGLPRLVAAGESAVKRATRSEHVTELLSRGPNALPLRVEYTLDLALTQAVYDIFERGRVKLGLAVVLDPATGNVLAYAGTDAKRLPPGEVYPAASLVKVVTAAAALESAPTAARRSCRYVGNPYRLTPARVVPPKRGTEITMERALAMSNNQCFAQLAVNDLGANRMLDLFRRFGLLQRPGPGHEAGQAADPHGDRFALGKLGCGLAGLQITALHAAEIAATLADGKRRAPRWIERVTDSKGEAYALPQAGAPVQVLTPALAADLREMMVATTVSGTARRAFHASYGRPILKVMTVAAKTGSLSGKTPPGRYEWLIALAPADRPKVAIAVLIVQQKRWHSTASQIGAQILNAIFCGGSVCRVDRADQWLTADVESPAKTR
ncbi:MAG: penicillin-binding transpeptidase domain-containing protein [Myxococcota bacterium]